MGEWFYGSGSIVFENQVEDDYFLIEDIISRYVNNRFFLNTTFSYIREVSDLKPFQTMKEKKENTEPMGYGFKRNASEREPLKIKGIHIMYTSEDSAFTKGEYMKMLIGLNSIFPIKQASFVFDSNYGLKESISIFSGDL